MAETLTDPSLQGKSPEATPQATPQEASRGFRAELRATGKEAYSLLDLSADIVTASQDIRHGKEELGALDAGYGGLLERQTASDVVSVALEADIILDYRRDAQRAGYTDVDSMPAELREQIVERAVRNRSADLISELEGHHPDWTREQLAAAAAIRINDVITLLSMGAEQRDEYFYALNDYRETQANIASLVDTAEALRDERRKRLGKIGGVAVRAVMSMFGAVRAVPAHVAAHVTVAGMSLRQKVGEWYQGRSPEGKKATIFTAASVAIAGIATYIGMRYGGYEAGSSQGANFVLAGNETDIANASTVGGSPVELPDTIKGSPVDIGDTVKGAPAEIKARVAGSPVELPKVIAGEPAPLPDVIAGNPAALPDVIAGNPSALPETIAAAGAPEVVATGADLRGAKTTTELFGDSDVQFWPDTVKVSAWDSKTKDGSLWGIGEEMLQRSGVKNPSDKQIGNIVDALRPQADAQGYLQKGQSLDLRPAIKLLP